MQIRASGGSGKLCGSSSRVALQEMQSLLIEFFDLFVYWCMRTPFKDQQL